MNEDVAAYVGDILIERGRKIADIGLSKREIEIIRLSAEGLSASEIAERLFLSVHTVNTHRQRIYAKMDVKNVSDMLRKANDLGLI
jgi:DNA-binding CsgD family transcriptional regulator